MVANMEVDMVAGMEVEKVVNMFHLCLEKKKKKSSNFVGGGFPSSDIFWTIQSGHILSSTVLNDDNRNGTF